MKKKYQITFITTDPEKYEKVIFKNFKGDITDYKLSELVKWVPLFEVEAGE